VVADGSVVLFSGNGANITRTLPEIAAALPNAVGREAVIRDGEILAPGPPWVPSFSRLTAPLAPMPRAWRRAAAGIVCKRLDTALGKDAAAEAQPIRPTCVCSGYSLLAFRGFASGT
jgi:hypothetical protein